MAVLSLKIFENKYVMDGPNGGQPGCKARRKVPKFDLPPIHVKRIQSDTRAKKTYIGIGTTPYLNVEGIENRTTTLTGIFAGTSMNATNVLAYEGIFQQVGEIVTVVDDAGGTIYELPKDSDWDIDSFSFDRSAVKRGIFEFTMILSYRWKEGEAES